MKKQIFAVCDLEAEYARNFMDYLNQKKNIPFEIQAFTNVSSFVAYAKENPVELLLISAEAMCQGGRRAGYRQDRHSDRGQQAGRAGQICRCL